jgi:subtilisin family serine protease
MLRRLVVVRSHEFLGAGWSARSFATAGTAVERTLKVAGVQFDEKRYPVPTFTRFAGTDVRAAALAASPTSKEAPPQRAYAMVGLFDDQEAVERLKCDKPDEVLGVFADPQIEPAPGAYCKTKAEGNFRDVRKQLGVSVLSKAKINGKGVRVAIVDTGINGDTLGPDGTPLKRQVNTKDFFSPDSSYVPGTAVRGHGTMCAFDVLLAAPKATLLDYALLQSSGATFNAFLSDAIALYADLIELMNTKPGPLVVNNSWALFDRSDDAAVGEAENYSANPNHPFNQIAGALVAAGADVLFAAGNCGQECPDGRCGVGDTGPGASIHGANSHASVLTVAAVTVKGDRLGYSSQGPGDLSDRKPNVAAYSHFAGSGVYQADGGTSAACPVAAGVVAALRQRWPSVRPGPMRGVIQRSAEAGDLPWSYDLGYGVINASAAYAILSKSKPAAKPKPAKVALASVGKAWMLQPTSEDEFARSQAALAAGQSRGGRGNSPRKKKPKRK